jgi:ABC-type uncharacterized transport system involved in gliding motility auxiliary subunit
MKKMKKRIQTLLLIQAFFLILTSCSSNSIESDAKRLAELTCKSQKLVTKAASGDMSVIEESTKLSAEVISLSNELKGKYTIDSDKEAFAKAYLNELKNCN